MKLVKMSLVAAMVMGASAFAVDNVKVSGDAKLYYGTSDAGSNSFFDKDASIADTALRIGATGDLLKGVSFGVTGYAVSTLGLENNLVSNTWTGAHGVTTGNGSSFDPLDTNGVQVDDQAWIGELWLATTMGKTTAKIGRMELDTPLAFSEKWSIVANTFDAAVLINQDIPNTTLVGAWVGKGNGVNPLGRDLDSTTPGVQNAGTINSTIIGDNVVGAGASFNTFMNNGAYAVAAINNSFKPLVAQAWYYNVSNVADAFWLQADWDCQLVKNVKVGAQYAEMSPKGALDGVNDTEAYALKVGYEGIQNLKLALAYSDVDKGGVLKMANVATDNLANAQSKLYTEAAWGGNFGYISAPDTESWNVKASYDMKDIAKFCASYTNADNGAAADLGDMEEIAVSASKSFGPLDTKLSLINTELDGGDDENALIAYLTLNF